MARLYGSTILIDEKPIRVMVCPYCQMPLSEEENRCCQEMGHGVYILIDKEGNEIDELGQDLDAY